MKSMKKVELIIEAVYLNRLLDLLKKHDINGYTVIRDIEGCGSHGLKTADDVSDLGSNIYLFTICDNEHVEHMTNEIRDFLSLYGGKCILSDVMLLLGTPQI